MNSSRACFIMGLPSAGKTSYLAALAYSLEQHKIDTKLHWEVFSGNQQYLAKLAETWLTVEPVARTSMSLQQDKLSWCLGDCDGNKFDISFPDLSGETFQKQYIDREIDSSLADSITASDGLIVFINPQGIIEPTLISDLPLLPRSEATDDATVKERIPQADDPTVTQLVVLLQDVAFLVENRKIPLEIIISAWDVVEGTYAIPETCLKERASLLWQFLKANDDIFLTSYFGVSAQGGRLENQEQSEALIDQYASNPAMRMSVIDNDGTKSHDITLPLWELLSKQMGQLI